MTSLPAWVPLFAGLLPLLAAALCALPFSRALGWRLVPFAALPALAAAALVPDGFVALPWLVTGVETGLDATGRAFLALAAAIWTAAGLYAAARPPERRAHFFGWFAVAMAGNLALCTVSDPAGFYTFFAMMALPTYALVAHGPGNDARRSGRVYLAFTVVGEAFLVCGLFAIGAAALGIELGTVIGPVGVVLVLAAFGIKIGALGLHGWMPISYAAAPAAAAAALAGSMSKAGVLGLLRFLPGGEAEGVAFGAVVMGFGVAAAFYGAVVGVMQTESKVVLAYSSMSQLGLITIGLGAGLAEPQAWPLAVTAATVYAVHHGLAKAALFLGDDIAARSSRRWPAIAALALPALALAGLPLTSGSVAKIVLKEATGLAPGAWHDSLETLLPLAAVGTTLLMARFLYLVATGRGSQERATGVQAAPGVLAIFAWALLLAAVAAAVWLWPAAEVRYAAEKSFTTQYLWLAAWPVALGVLLAGAAWAGRAVTRRVAGAIPPADVYAPLFSWSHDAIERRDELVGTTVAPPSTPAPAGGTAWDSLLERAGAIERGILAWASAISVVAVLTVYLLLLAARG